MSAPPISEAEYQAMSLSERGVYQRRVQLGLPVLSRHQQFALGPEQRRAYEAALDQRAQETSGG